MRAVMLKSYTDPATALVVEDIPVPPLRSRQVLVKMAAAPINPSDLIFLRGQYGITKPLPVVPGFEGSGTVVKAGGGLYANWLVGQRVACRAAEYGHGTWAEYMATSADGCIPLRKSISEEQGATFIVNPLTAWALINLVREGRHRAFVQTAAASALGQMIARLSLRYHVPAIHIVRRPEQVQLLLSMGCKHVLDSNEPGFVERLKEFSLKWGATIALDAVGGELTQRLAKAMPKGSRIIIYGALAGDNCQVSHFDLIFRDQRIEGFWLTQWVKNRSWAQKMLMVMEVQSLLPTELNTHIQARFPLEKVHQAIELYKANRTGGKVLLVPGSRRVKIIDKMTF